MTDYVKTTDTFDQWRVKTNELRSDLNDVTSATLNSLSPAHFTQSATGGEINVTIKDGAIKDQQVASDASIAGSKLADDSITPAKLSAGGPSWDTAGDVHIQSTTNASDTHKLKVSAYRPNIVLEDKSTDAQDLQLHFDEGVFSVRVGDATAGGKLTSESLRLQGGSLFTAGEAIEINALGTDNRNAYIDFHSSSTSNSDYDARIIKESGDNSAFIIQNYGTGSIVVRRNANEDLLKLDSSGHLNIRNNIVGFNNTSEIGIYGGTIGNGAHIELYGGSHATTANKAFYDADRHTFRNQDATEHTVIGSGLDEGIGSPASDFTANSSNIILKPANNGVSGIFFQSKDNHGTGGADSGFIQYHSYGAGNTSGEKSELIIGTTNDNGSSNWDRIVFNPPGSNGLIVRYGDDTTEHRVATETSLLPNIVSAVSTKSMRSLQDLPDIDAGPLHYALWPANKLRDTTSTRTWEEIRKYPLHVTITSKRENSKFRINVQAYGGVQGDDECGILITYKIGSFAWGDSLTDRLITTIRGADDGAHNKGLTFKINNSGSDRRAGSGSYAGLWNPQVAAGTTFTFFLSLFGLNDDDDRIMFNTAYDNATSSHVTGSFPTTIMVEEIYTQQS